MSVEFPDPVFEHIKHTCDKIGLFFPLISQVLQMSIMLKISCTCMYVQM